MFYERRYYSRARYEFRRWVSEMETIGFGFKKGRYHWNTTGLDALGRHRGCGSLAAMVGCLGVSLVSQRRRHPHQRHVHHHHAMVYWYRRFRLAKQKSDRNRGPRAVFCRLQQRLQVTDSGTQRVAKNSDITTRDFGFPYAFGRTTK
jgi:hypothetical protein